MTTIKQLTLAVIGDEDLVNALRLAGVSRYYVIKGQDAREEVRQALTKLTGEPEVGIIVLQEGYTEYVADLVKQVQEGEKLTPVIIEVPSKHGTKYGDVAEYYRGYIRRSIGFDIKI